MSLQVWLPLIKDFENYGLSDLKFSRNTQYRYIRFVVDAIKGGSDTYTQFSRLEFIDTDGNLYKYPSGTSVSTSMTGYPASESPSNVIDGNVNTKFCTLWSAGGYLTIDLGSTGTIDIDKYSRFQWYTANDGEWRDPVSFRMLFSVDGVNFNDGVTVTNASITANRFALAYTGNCLPTAVAPNGKIGRSCYYNNSNYNSGVLSNTKLKPLDSNVSMFAWIKLDNFNINPIGIGGTHTIIGSGYPAATGMGFNIVQSPANGNIRVVSVNTGNGTTRTWNAYYGTTAISAGIWYHVGFTYDGTYIRIYVNGKLDATYTYTGQSNPADYVHVFSWSRDGTIATPTVFPHYNPIGSINDFRIYDHVLTPKEIKEISKGLVAHYQLKGMGKTNYLKGAGLYTKSNPLIRNSNDVSHMNDSYVYHNDVFSVTVPSNGTYSFVLESDGVPTGHSTTGTSHTSRYFSMWLQNASTGDHYLWGTYGTGAGGEKYGQFTIPAGTYKVRTNLYAADNVNYTVKMWNIKLISGIYEPNDVWCPNSDDELYKTLGLDSNKESDVSGYGNHGTKTAAVTVAGDSPRYGTCYVFPNSSYIACGRGAMVRDAITVSCWGYMDNWSDYAGRRLVSCTEGGGWNLEPSGDSSANGMCFAIGTGATSNTYFNAVSDIACKNLSSGWHMFTGTYDGYITKIYIDGVLRGSSSTKSEKTPIFYNASNGIFIGAEAGGSATTAGGQYFNGKISDLRIYATALSASDIADMYNVPASVTKNGKLLAYDFHENNKNSIDKNGVISSSSFNDKIVPLYDMKIKALGDGSTWARIHHLDVTKDKQWFASASEVAKCTNKHNRYSRMGDVDKFKVGNDYEFMLTYPSMKKSVPAGYTELEYIEATGTQFINTGVTGNARWEFDIEFKTGINHRQLMGYYGSGQEYWGVQVHGGYGVHEDQTLVGVAAGKRDTVVHSYGENNDYSIWVQNKSVGISSAINVSSYQYQIFCIMNMPDSFGCHAKLWRCKCIQNNSLIRDFVPAIRNSDGAIGLIDVVNNVFYGNAGSGSFVAGGTKDSIPLYNRWIQTSSPSATAVSGYKAISTSWTAHNAGIRTHGTTCLYNCDTGDTWYAPIGQYVTWTETQYIPAADGSSQTETELWVRVDRFSNANQFKIYNGSMIATDYIEI